MINNIVLMGRLTDDPELRTTSNGTEVASFILAVDRDFSKPGEEKQADFIPVTAWRATAKFITNYFHKGSMIAIHGALHTRGYEDKNGNKRTAFEVDAQSVSFCGGKRDDEPKQTKDRPEQFDNVDTTDEDFPF